MNPNPFLAPFVVALTLFVAVMICAQPATSSDAVPGLGAAFDRLLREKQIVGAQVVAGKRERILLKHYVGTRTVGGAECVDARTLFCIGSNSKPMAAALIMALVAEGTLRLDEPISKWLPEFGSLKLRDGTPAHRPPAVRELLSHRSGIFSQKDQTTPGQLALLYDFSRSLQESVRGIARQPLSAQPGERYAYSGAGYCVLGRVAEAASGRSIEGLLQARLCRPMQLERTTYFPGKDRNMAVGSPRRENGAWAPDRQVPHLAPRGHRMALVGGSIYSTASDQARFARMVLDQGRIDGKEILPSSVWHEWVEHQSASSKYGLGWIQPKGRPGELPKRLSHEGALGCYRAVIVVNLGKDFFCAAHWTLWGLENDTKVRAAVLQAIHGAEKSLLK